MNKSLLHNVKQSSSEVTDYFLHIFTKTVCEITNDTLKGIVTNFATNRIKNLEIEEFFILNKNSLKTHSFIIDDTDYYIELLGCVICKDILRNYAALLIHYKTHHPEMTYFTYKHHNSQANLKEAHVIAFVLEKNKFINNCNKNGNEEDKNEDNMHNNANANLVNKHDYIINKETDDFGVCYSLESSLSATILLLENKIELANDNNINYENNNNVVMKGNVGNCIGKKDLMNSQKNTFRLYPVNTNSYIDGHLVLFDCITGSLHNDLQEYFENVMNNFENNNVDFNENRAIRSSTVNNSNKNKDNIQIRRNKVKANNLENNCYEMGEENYIIKEQNYWIDNHCNNVDLITKRFFKAWNKFINDNMM